MSEPVHRDKPKISVTISAEALEFLDGAWGGAGTNKGKSRSYCANRLILYVKGLFEREAEAKS